MNDKPAVDVLVPIFNGAPYLTEALTSILEQTISNIALRVVDDGSTDETPQLLAKLAQADSRVHVYRKENGGIVEALNYGLTKCTSDFVARHDADDIALPHRLERQLAIFQEKPDLIAVGGSALHIDPQGRLLGTRATFSPPENADAERIPALEPYLLHPFLMVRRQALAGCGGYRHVVHAEDTDLYWRLIEQGGLVNDDEVVGHYRLHPGSISSSSIRNGRLMAMCSQLAALSALRRRRGVPDLDFSAEFAQRLKASSDSLDALMGCVSPVLDADEAQHLRIATVVKLLELADYRPYELDRGDCRFARAALEESLDRVPEPNRGTMIRKFTGTAARLASLSRWSDAMGLIRPQWIMSFISKYALRVLLPKNFHAIARRVSMKFRRAS